MGADRFNYLQENDRRKPDEVPLLERIARAHGLSGAERYTGRVMDNQTKLDATTSPRPIDLDVYHSRQITVGHVERFSRRTRSKQEVQREKARQRRRDIQKERKLTKQRKKDAS